MLKNSSIVLSSHTSWLAIYTPTTPPVTSPYVYGRITARRKSLGRPANTQYRTYAIAAAGYGKNEHEPLSWPEITSTKTIPTPYQIFNQKKGSPYSKHRFYELVKLYHPDRHVLKGLSDDVPYATKLERYRLVVAANELLSDPMRREAYDHYGAGWNGQPGVGGCQGGSYTGVRWSESQGSPFQNATWEDWEKWYARGERAEQSTKYVSNGAFVTLIVIFAAAAGFGQATRIENYSIALNFKRDAIHNATSKELMRRRKETTSLPNQDHRVHTFLKQRDPLGHGVTDAEEEAYRKALPEPQVCSSGDIKARPMDVYDMKKEGET